MIAHLKHHLHMLRLRYQIWSGIRQQRRLRLIRAERAKRGWQTRLANERRARA